MKTPRGFTLLELLVVITIIGVLAGLIFPVLKTARASARTAACLGNLRQVALAIQFYVNDHDGRMPSLQNRSNTNEPLPALDTELLTYVSGQRAVFACPADDRQLFQTTGTSYFWNFTVNGQDITRLFSLAGGSDATHIPLVSDKEGFHPNLKDRVNVLYADGHVDKEIKFSTGLQ